MIRTLPVRVVRLALVCVAASIGALASSARADWLDDMPSVPSVVQAVRDEIRESKNPDLAGDPDHLATQLAGTFLLLRWLMLFEALRETNPTTLDKTQPVREPNVSAPRRAHMDAIATEYRQVELVIERGVGTRKGSDKKICDRKDTNLNRFGQKTSTLEACYLERYRRGVNYPHITFSYRKAIFARLFCDKWQLYHERYNEYYKDGDGYRPAGQRVTRPQNYAFVRVKEWPVIAQPMTTAAVCAAHGGDANGDGICDAWQAASQAVGASACASAPEPVTVLGITQHDLLTIRVDYSSTKIPAHAPVLELARLDKSLQQRSSIPSSIVLPLPVATDPAKQVAFLRTPPGALDVDASKPNLAVHAGPGGRFGGAGCRQATPIPPFAEYEPDYDAQRITGIFGHYDTAHLAAEQAEPLARDLGDDRSIRAGWFVEVVGYVLRDLKDTRGTKGKYYVTRPTTGPGRFDTPTASGADFEKSFRESFVGSCDQEGEFERFALFHTHPTHFVENNNYFSAGDWSGFAKWRTDLAWPKLDTAPPNERESRQGFYLFRPDRCIDFTDGKSDATSVGAKVDHKGAPCAVDSSCRDRPERFFCN